MNEHSKTKEQLITELSEMRQRIAELQASLTKMEHVEGKQDKQAMRSPTGEPEGRVRNRTIDLESTIEELEKEISARRETEAALRDSEERLGLALEAAELSFWDWDLTTGKAIWSSRSFDMLGYSPHDFGADVRTWKRMIHPDDWPNVRKGLNDHLDGARPTYEAEYRLQTKSGDWAWIAARGKVVERDPNGQPVRMLGTSQDITNRKRAEEEIRNQKEFLNTVVESLSHPFYVINADDYTIELANRATKIPSLDDKPTCYSVLQHRDSPCDGLEHPCAVERVKKTGGPVVLEFAYQDRKGRPRCAEIHGHPIFDAQGRVVRIIEYSLDITDRKLAEEALRKSEANFRAVFDSMNEAIFVHDMATGEILDVNRKMCEMYGYPIEEALRLTIEQLSSGEPLYSQEDAVKWTRLAAQGQPQLFDWHAKDKDGRLFWVEVNLKRAVIGGQDRLLAVVRDISERKLAEEERERLRSQLLQAQKVEAIGTLTGGIAHDFNNMLTVILGYSEMLLMDRDENDPAYADLQKILQTGRSGAELVQRLMTFGRNAETNSVPLDLNRQVRNLERLLSRTLPKMVQIELRLGEGLAPVNADPAQMDQMVMNLAINANEAMPEGGKLTIETASKAFDGVSSAPHPGVTPGDYVMLSVSDTGAGMDKQTQERIFDPFFTTKGWDSRKGTGLGLPVVYGIVERHGGCIECVSEPGKGTTFNIYLPRLVDGPSSGLSDSGKAPEQGTETILLVDDEDLVRELGERILTRSGYKVLMAENGAEALEVFTRNQSEIGLVILDLVMPGLGGKQCLAEMLKIDPSVKVLIASGYTAGDLRTEAVDLGARGFVGKPYNVKQMLQAVRAVLDDR
ncbi:MAG: PAS domain S-box protein [Desulfomonile tiedjei]|nr:PAS domain S-box protein [Desulfomonile tiedjei]